MDQGRWTTRSAIVLDVASLHGGGGRGAEHHDTQAMRVISLSAVKTNRYGSREHYKYNVHERERKEEEREDRAKRGGGVREGMVTGVRMDVKER